MFPFYVDPRWYDKYWLTEQPYRNRPPRRANMARLVVVVVLLAGSGLILKHLDDLGAANGNQSWEEE
jgi:hypothetical protein